MSLVERLAGAARRLAPRTMEVDGLRIAWGEVGSGPPIVLVHGLAASGWWWQRNLQALSAGHRVLVVDLAGFGASRRQPFRLATAATRLGQWLDAVGAGPAAVVGHSLGGYVAADLAAARPDVVERLVLVDAAALPLQGPVRGHVRNLLRGGGRSERALVRIAIVDIARAGPIGIVHAARQLLASDLSPRLGAIQAPTLVVWGEEDALIPPSQGRRLAGAIPGARFVSIPGAGHAPMWERPDLFDPLVLDFLSPRGASRDRHNARLAVVEDDDAGHAPGGDRTVTDTGVPRAIVAVVGEDGRFEHVRRRAIERARETGATLVLFDLDAGKSLLESPRPTNWSAQGEEEQYGHRLTSDDLEALGRGPIAAQVRDARVLGIDAFGWLPDKADASSLRDYAAEQGAGLVLVPAGEPDLADDLGVPVEVVGSSAED